MFKWICLGAAAVFGVVLLVLIVDLKRDVSQTVDTVNGQLPEIIGEVRSGNETLAGLPEDVELVLRIPAFRPRSSVKYCAAIS